jgi:hypothetical protein
MERATEVTLKLVIKRFAAWAELARPDATVGVVTYDSG